MQFHILCKCTQLPLLFVLKDGFIDYLEFLAAINLVIRGKIDQKLKWYFKLYDIDGSGTIDKKEVISMLMVSKCTN